MKVGILINCLEFGGAERMALHVFNLLDNANIEVYMFIIDGTQDMPLHPDPSRARELATKVFHLSKLNTNSPTTYKILLFPWQFLNLEYYIRKFKLDILLSFEDRANIFNMLTLKSMCRVISIRHPMVSVLFLKQWIKRFLIDKFFKLFLRRIDIANFNSFESQKEFQQYFHFDSNRLSVIHNFIDHKTLENDAQKDCIPSQYLPFFENPIIMACGRFKPVKGFHRLIRVFKAVHDACPDTRLIILGNGPLYKELNELRADLELEDAVLFPGFVENTAAWISKADIFVLSSLSEGFPNVLLEAMALKIPIVSTDCIAGPREILAPKSDYRLKTKTVEYSEYGILTSPLTKNIPFFYEVLDHSEQYLAKALTTLIKDKKLISYYAKKAYQRSLDFSLENGHQGWFSLIAQSSRNNI